MEFLYYLYSFGDKAQLAVQVQDALGNISTLWTRGGLQSSAWLVGSVNVQSPVQRPFKVVFAATQVDTKEIDMALDTVSIRLGPCTPCVTGCDFDTPDDLCGWENPADGDVQWEPWLGQGEEPGVGPEDDFSRPGFGSYMLLNAWVPESTGSALLRSPPYQSQGGCLSLSFYYTLHGVGNDTVLKVYVAQVAAGGELGSPLLTLSGEHGPNWTPGTVNYTGIADIQFVLEGTFRGKPGLAVDSVQVSPCEEIFTQCDFNDNANPFCGWVNSGDNAVTWTRTNQSTPTEETGPPGDYPNGEGYYIYVEGGSLVPGQSVRLTSRAFCTDTEACVEFYYYMYGIVEVQTQLRVLAEGPSGMVALLWTRTGIQSPTWLLGSVTVPYGGPQPSKVLFEVVRGNNPYLDVALDNISVRRGPCTGSGTPVPPTSSSTARPTHTGPAVTIPPVGPMTSHPTTVSQPGPSPTSHVVTTTTHGRPTTTTPQSSTVTEPHPTTVRPTAGRTTTIPTAPPSTSTGPVAPTVGSPSPATITQRTSPITSTTSSTVGSSPSSAAPTGDSHVSSTSPATSDQESQTSSGVPGRTTPVSHTTSAAASTTSASKTTTIGTTASHGNTTSSASHTQPPVTSPASSSQPTTTTGHTSLAVSTFTTSSHTTVGNHTTPGHSQTSTTTHRTSATTSSTSLAPTPTTSDSTTSTTKTTVNQDNTTVSTSASLSTGHTQLPITSPANSSRPSTTTGHTSRLTTMGNHTTPGHSQTSTTTHGTSATTSSTSLPPTSTTSDSTTSTTRTTANQNNTTVSTSASLSTGHTQLPITSPASSSQPSTTTGHTSSVTTTRYSSSHPSSTTTGQTSPKVSTPAPTHSSTPPLPTNSTSHTQLPVTGHSTTTGHTSLPVSSFTTSPLTQRPSTTAGATSRVTAATYTSHHPSSTFPVHPSPNIGTTASHPDLSSPSPTSVGSPTSSHANLTTPSSITTTPLTTPGHVSSSPATTSSSRMTTSQTTLQTSPTLTSPSSTAATIHITSALTEPPGTSPTTTSPGSPTSRHPSPAITRTTGHGTPTPTVPLLTSSTTSTTQVHVSPTTQHTTTVGHANITSTSKSTTTVTSTRPTSTTPGGGHISPTTVGHTGPISSQATATTTTVTPATSTVNIASTSQASPATSTPQIRTTTPTPDTTSHAVTASRQTTVTITEKSSTKMPVGPDATTTAAALQTTTARPIPTLGASTGTKVTTTTPVTPPDQVICTISGDPHYTTYDGRLFHFMGTCTYLLSALCNATADLPTFRVQATNEHRGANKQVSYVKSISVEVYETQIVLLKSRRVMVNGQRVTLPISVAMGQVSVRLSGTFVLVQTDFGFSVRFDGNHHAEVSVPPSYYGQVCGLCGNYNGQVTDDNLMPNGTSAGSSADKLGESWQVPDAGDAGCSNSGDPGECDKDIAAEAEKPTSCGILTDPQGPFAPCHSKVPPEGAFENCVYDLCGTGGDAGTLCFALQSYADRCAQAGITIAWRNNSFCPLNCPPGSSYVPCGPACPATCRDAPSQDSCSGLPCVEGCVCDEGRVLSGDQCVPIDQCGCTDTSGQYHPVGESWMGNSECTQRCTCGTLNSITCQEWSCSPIQECRPLEGLMGCQDTGVAACHVAGDPHYYTFDGTMVSFMGTCTYTLVTLCHSDPRLPSFNITAKNEERGQPEASYLRLVTVEVARHTVTLQKNRRVLIDGQRVRTPVEGRIPGVSITSSGIYVVLETDFGLVVKFDGNHHLEIQLPGTYFDKVCGMCGNFNNQTQDDLLMPNGHLATNDSQFGNSWKAPGDADPGCQPDDREDLEPSCSQEEMERLRSLCLEVLQPKYQPCHGIIDPQPFVQNCFFDMCEYQGMASVLCDIIQSYVEACKSQGVTGLSWRNSTFCPLPCPLHSHYTECASPCPATCCNLYAPASCQSRTTCVEGCTCDRGYVLSDDSCVSMRDCGCLDSQYEYHSPGDTWVTTDCRQHCTCNGNGHITCHTFECLPGSLCTLSSTGLRYCQPTKFHQCVISGDPHYRTFDNFVHHFQGRSTYALTQTLEDLPVSLVPFSVAGRNRRRFPLHRFSFLREVYISVYGHSITLMQKRKMAVDGLAVTPPYSTQDGSLQITQSGRRLLLQTDFGLSVSFDGRDFAEISLPSTYQDYVGGLCGNYDGRRNNEYMKPDGTWTRFLNTFGNSWQVSVRREMKAGSHSRLRREEPSDEVETGFEIDCSPEQLMFVNGTDACGALSDPQGPFAACHSILLPDTFQESCVYDLCALFNDTELLCQDYEAYAQVCQEEGVTLGPWRQETGCAVSCPPHTTYQSCMTACPASCANMAAPSDCEAPCVEGCASDPGYILSGLDSVPYNQCGCTSNDQYYQINDTFWTDNCSQLCTCRNTGTLECQAGGCASGEICALANYTLGCFQASACLSNPCQNEGTCQDTSEGFLCSCLEGYAGLFCEETQGDESPTAALPLETSTVPPTSPPSEENNHLTAILLGVFIPLGILVIMVGTICFCRQRNRREMKEDRTAVLSVAGQISASGPSSERITHF
ncbi:zonadhesin isoform X2 [Sceloporus undulatus]|uniref:zonadhesin isoform X2 n=1 Tax=Sceloporus undulatus TaxID=8520 RepID=UPI001C4B8DCF|nr:zonadhesin isoform X2 [Sceloporus undulatus]